MVAATNANTNLFVLHSLQQYNCNRIYDEMQWDKLMLHIHCTPRTLLSQQTGGKYPSGSLTMHQEACLVLSRNLAGEGKLAFVLGSSFVYNAASWVRHLYVADCILRTLPKSPRGEDKAHMVPRVQPQCSSKQTHLNIHVDWQGWVVLVSCLVISYHYNVGVDLFVNAFLLRLHFEV